MATRAALLGKLVLALSRATPEELAAVYRFATGELCRAEDADSAGSRREPGTENGSGGMIRELRELARMPEDGAEGDISESKPTCQAAARKGLRALPAAESGRAYVFRWTGRDWQVVFGGGTAFHLPNMLGARYLDYLLHHPNELISAFDLEVAVTPEKGEARSTVSIQAQSDPRAMREYREELGRLQAERRNAEAAGDREEAARLEEEIRAIKSVLREDGLSDTGKRAYDNVRQAFRVLIKQLRRGGREERAFEGHLRAHLSLGFECQYSPPERRIWG